MYITVLNQEQEIVNNFVYWCLAFNSCMLVLLLVLKYADHLHPLKARTLPPFCQVSLAVPSSDIWCPRPETCSNLFTWVPSPHPPRADWLLATEALMVGERAVRILLESFLFTLLRLDHTDISVYCAQVTRTCFVLIQLNMYKKQTDWHLLLVRLNASNWGGKKVVGVSVMLYQGMLEMFSSQRCQ